MSATDHPASYDTLSDDPALVLLDQTRLAELLGCSARTLERQRLEGTGIPFCRVGRLVRYRLVDVTEFLESQRRRSTSDGGHRDADAHSARRARQARFTRRGRGLSAGARDPDRLAARRRSRPQAAQTLRPYGGRKPGMRDRRDRGLRGGPQLSVTTRIFWLRLSRSSCVSRALKLGTTPPTMWRRCS